MENVEENEEKWKRKEENDEKWNKMKKKGRRKIKNVRRKRTEN